MRDRARVIRHDPLTHPVALAVGDRRDARVVGRADAHDFGLVDAKGVLYVDRWIDAHAARLLSDGAAAFARERERVEWRRKEAAREQRRRRIEWKRARRHERRERASAHAAQRGRGSSRIGLVTRHVVLFAVALPGDWEAAVGSPLPAAGQIAMAVGLGAGMVVAAAAASGALEELREAHDNRRDDELGLVLASIKLAVALILPVLLIVAVAVWRGQALADVARATAGLIHGGAMSVALGLLTAVAFVTAVLGGATFERGHAVRAARRSYATAQSGRRAAEQQYGQATAAEEQAVMKLARLHQERDRRIDSIRAWAEERKAGIRHRAAATELRHRHRHAGNGTPLASFNRRAGGFRIRSDERGG
jgi:hypothetical protein